MNGWSELHTKTYNHLSGKAIREATRYHPDYTRDFTQETDAPNIGVGALLYQIDENGNKLIIKPITAKLKNSEMNWGTTEKEVYAIIWALQKLEM